ncbi:striated muscle-specific serine/threonine-protein kinase-like, partial [Rhinoraja longicauda]
KEETEDPLDDEDTILRKMRLLTDYYDIHHEIGRGAFSCVRQVTEKSSGAVYAAKLISFRATPRDRAVRELRVLSQLDHERVVYFHDAFEKKNSLTIVMELCPQEELLDRMAKKPTVQESEVRYFIQQILEGIRYLHQNNILHLDIKPDNILLAHPGSDTVRICDFGNALELTPDTPQFSRLGTPEYVAPEIIAQTPVSPATDVWPVGVIAYIGLTGVSPFSGENDRSTLLNVKNYDVAFEEKMFTNVSRESKGFVTSLLVEDMHRPSAEDCLHHVWFSSGVELEGKLIDTEPLRSLVSRRKWQRSLISYKSSMVVRSIPDVLADPSGPPSLGLPRQLRDPRLSSSSDSDEIDELPLLPMPASPEFRASRRPLRHLREQAQAEAQAQEEEEQRRTGPQGADAGDQRPTQAPREMETETGPQAPARPGPKAPARKRLPPPTEAGPVDSSDEEAPQAGGGGPSREAADWPPAHSSASRRRGDFRRGSSADSALALLGADGSLGLEAETGAQLSPAGGGLKKSVSMELPRRSPSPSPRRPDEGPGGRRRAGPASEDYSLKLELLRQRLLRGGSVDNKMSGLRGPLLEHLGLPDDEPQRLGPLPLERQTLRPPRPDKQSRLARAASSDSAPMQEEPERRALRKTASFSQAEPPTLHRRLGAPLEIPLQPAGPRAPSPELQFPLKESPSLSALTEPLSSRPVTPVRASRPQEARPLTPHIQVVPAPKEADGPCTKVMIGRTAVVTHSNLTVDPKPEPPSTPARPDPTVELTRPKPTVGLPWSQTTVELTRPKPILGQARPDPTLDLTRPKPIVGQARLQPIVELIRPKPMLGQAKPQPILDQARLKPTLEQARPQPTLAQARPEPPSPLRTDRPFTPPAPEGTMVEGSNSRPVPGRAEPPRPLPLPEGKSPATAHQVGPAPPAEPVAITPPPGFRSTDRDEDEEEERQGKARLGPEAWAPPVREKASSVAQSLNVDDMESEEVFEARFKRGKESSLSRSLKQLIRPRSEEKMEPGRPASASRDLRYRPGATGQPLQLEPKAQEPTARSRSEQNIPEASKDRGFMRKLSLRLKGGPAEEERPREGEGGASKHSWSLGRGGGGGSKEVGEGEGEETGGPSRKKGPKSSPGLTVRRKIESTISGLSLRFGRSQSEERVQEEAPAPCPGPTQREAKESKRPFLSLLRRSTSEAGSLKRVGVPQNQLAAQTGSAPSTESLQSDASLSSKQER